MSNLAKLNRFAYNPITINHKRSKFNLNHNVSTTLNTGDIVPLMCQEVLPGDSFKLSFSSVLRMMTPALPVMDNAYIDYYAFWVPSRISVVHYKDWEKIFGENVNSYWTLPSEEDLSTTGNTFILSSTTQKIQPQSLGDYLGFRIGFYKAQEEFSMLPFNAYWFIYDEFFRDQNTQAPSGWRSWTSTQRAQHVYDKSMLAHSNKFHDLFTSALPSPQKGPSVLLPIVGNAPVITGSVHTGYQTTLPAMQLVNNASSAAGGTGNYYAVYAKALNSGGRDFSLYKAVSNTGSSNISTGENYVPSNLWADMSAVTMASVNDLRQLFAIQKLLETNARGGTRFREYLYNFYGVSIPDNTVQVPEYLGGTRIPINMLQVLQTAQDSSSPLGTTGAFSNTTDNSYLFTKSFSEHGFVFLLATIRVNQSYCQGIPLMFKRLKQYHYYNPVFANLGEQAIKTYELYADNSINFETDIFGYKEAWAEYRFIPSRVTGYLSPDSGDLITPHWTYVNNFTAKPVLNSSFMVQSKTQLDNTLAVTGGNYQFILNGFVTLEAWREMPYYSIPGLIDHA